MGGMHSTSIQLVSNFVGAVVEEVRTIFEQRNDSTIYIPNFITDLKIQYSSQ
jgi:hypothetical protein